MNTGERIRQARLAAGLTQTELADKVGLKFSAIHKYESGLVVNLKREKLSALAQALGVSESWLLCLEGTVDVRPPRDIDPIYDALNDTGRKELCRYGRYLTGFAEYQAQDARPQITYIRHYLVPAAAGYASPIEGEDFEEIPLPAGAPADADFCIDIQGDSMEPYIRDGERVYVKLLRGRGRVLQAVLPGLRGGDLSALRQSQAEGRQHHHPPGQRPRLHLLRQGAAGPEAAEAGLRLRTARVLRLPFSSLAFPGEPVVYSPGIQ